MTGMIDRGEGRVAFDEDGTGPLVVLVPGMGDLRQTYRFLAPALVAAGYRVVTTELRGHGDSATTFSQYGDEATAGDIAALIEHLGEPAVVIGNSMAAGSAVLVAGDRPELVRGLVLVGPFVRNPPNASRLTTVLFRIATAAPWAASVWKSYLPKLYAGRLPEDFEAYRAAVTASIRRPGYAKAFSLTTRTSHDAAERALPRVSTPTLIVMGELDPDFPKPAEEAAWIGERLGAEILMVPDAGHYPQSQRPELVSPAVASFLSRVVPLA